MQGRDSYNPKPQASPTRQNQKSKLFADFNQRFPAWTESRRSGPEEAKELSDIKQRAINVERNRTLRTEAATKIQSVYRGHLDRIMVAEILSQLSDRYKIVRLEEIKQNLQVLFAPSKIYYNVIRWWGRIQERKVRMIQAYYKYAATYIQKVWRGYHVWRKMQPEFIARILAKKTMNRLARLWKGKRISNLKVIQDYKKQCRDIKKLCDDFADSGEYDMHNNMQYQYELLLGKFKDILNRMFVGDNWIKNPQKFQMSHNREPSRTFDEVPARTFDEVPARTFDEVPAERVPERDSSFLNDSYTEDYPSKTPPKFSNFLKRSHDKYDPKKSMYKSSNSDPSKSKNTTSTSDPSKSLKKLGKESKFKQEPRPEIPPVPIPEHNVLNDSMYQEMTEPSLPPTGRESSQSDEEVHQEKPEAEPKAPFPFLKRKSQVVQPSKFKPKAQPRTDCWTKSKKKKKGSPTKSPSMPLLLNLPQPESQEPFEPPSFEPLQICISSEEDEDFNQRSTPDLPDDPIEPRVLALEKTFNELEEAHISIDVHLLTREKDSVIPQFTTNSYFITHYTEDIYYETIDALENHYTFLCSEENVE